MKRLCSGLLVLCMSGATLAAAPQDARLYHREYQASLPGSGDSWGFAALEPTRPYLYLARRENGLSVFDVQRRRLVKTLENSSGANAVVFVPGLDRFFVLNTDGSLSVVERSSLKVLRRIKVAQSNLNSAVYEPLSGRVIIASGRRADHSTLFVFDPKQEKIIAEHDLPVKKIDPLLVKGDGSFFLPMRDEGVVARLSATTFAVLDRWQFEGCTKPSALAQDAASQRLFVACRGEQPQLLVADLNTGELRARLPISRDVNALAFDAVRRRLVMPSGVDGNLTLVQQGAGDQYRLLATVSTQPMAYNMAFDPLDGKVYLPSMDFTLPATVKGQARPDPLFHANTFTLTTWAP